MGIFRRVSDIVSANVSDVVDRFEAPETMLRQALREMDVAIARTMGSDRPGHLPTKRLIEHELARHRETVG